MDEVVLATLVAWPWLTVAIVAALSQWRAAAHAAARLAGGMTGAGFVIAVLAAVLTFATVPTHLQIAESSVQLDPLSVLLTMLVLGLSALIQSYAVRYLRGDPRQGWFVVSAAALTAATVLLVCAASVLVFAVAWLLAGGALIAALATYPGLAQAREGVRRTALRFAIADTALVTGVTIIMVAEGGDRPLSELESIARALGEPLGVTVAVLLVVGALARSSQIPFQGWLPFTLASPTPVSALMHAGVVNAGAILLVRFSPFISAHHWVMVMIVLTGGMTLVWASAARLVRPDVKGRLVYSTMAQMGFMIMACGLGAYAAAIFHLIAHSLYKSSLFLGAGTGVRRHVTQLQQPPGEPALGARRVLAALIAIVVPVTGLIGAELLLAPAGSPASMALLAFVAVAGAITLGSALNARFTTGTVLAGVGSIVLLIFAYTAFVTGFSAVLEPIPAVAPAPGWLVAFPAAALLIVEVLNRTRASPGLRDRVYTRALTATTPRLSPAKGLPR